MLIMPERLTTITILYWRPDYRSLLQEFLWQTQDLPPEFPRMMKFLDHWRTQIDAVIHRVNLAYEGRDSRIRKVDATFLIDKLQ